VRQPSQLDAFKRLKQAQVPIQTILDVGVQYSTLSLIEAFPDRLHLLFESNGDYFDYICKNYKEKNIRHELFCGALSDKDTVESSRLDTLLVSRDDGPYLLKIDIDGGEHLVLDGAEQTLQQCNVVVVEVQPITFRVRCGMMLDMGFVLYDIVDLCYYDDWLAECDMVFVKPQFMPKITGQFDHDKWQLFRPRG